MLDALPLADRRAALTGLAQALQASAAWRTMHGTVLAVRHDPPLLAAFGSWDAAAAARWETLRWQLERLERGLRHVDYEQAAEDARRLAGSLLDRLGPDELARAEFRGLPRGGGIVRSLLAYALELRGQGSTAAAERGGPVILVDDCALSGARLRDALRQVHGGRPVVVALLYAPPALRRAIEAAEPAVRFCLAAADLADEAPAVHGQAYAAWRARWQQRSPDGYWVGLPELISFSWSEPDLSVFNPVTGSVEAGWRLVPPARCLKNRPPAGSSAAPVQVQPQPAAPLRPAPDTVFAEVEGEVVVASVDSARAVTLPGVAGDMWRALIRHGTVGGAADELLRRYEVSAGSLRRDLGNLLRQLLEEGYLVDC
jgi:hypothetical protein